MRLVERADAGGTERALPHLETLAYGRSIAFLDTTFSTNDDAKRAALDGRPRGHVVVADAQSGGRGARGHVWASPPGTDLYFSVVERGWADLRARTPLTLAVGLGVCRALTRHVAPSRANEVRIKWPNDVFLGTQKCAGVLVEASTGGGLDDVLIVGVGVNVNRTEFGPALAPIATSLAKFEGRPFERDAVLADLLEEMERAVDRFRAHGAAPLAEQVSARLYGLDGAPCAARLRLDGAPVRVLGVEPDGALRVSDDAGVRRVESGALEVERP